MNEMMEEIEPIIIKDIGIKPKRKLGIGLKIGIFIVSLLVLAILYLIASVAVKSYNRSKYQDEFYVQQKVKEYLEERYDEEFVVMFNRGMSGAYNYVQLYAYPIFSQDEMHKIEIQGYYNEKGKMDFYDDYVMIKLTEEYEAYIDPIIDEYFDEYKFYIDFNSEWLTNNLPADTKLEDLWELKANVDYPLPSIFIYLKEVEKENYNRTIIEQLTEQLQKYNVRGHMEIVIHEDDIYYDKRNRETLYENIGVSAKDVKLSVIFIYDNKVDISIR